MTSIVINIDPIEPLRDDEVREYQLHREKIVLELGYFGGYLAKVGKARADLEQAKGEAEVEVKKLVKKVKSKNFEYDPSAYKGKSYTREDLVDLLQNFNKNHGRLPASSDARRGLLPSVSTFHKYFGRWSVMLKEVFPETHDN